MDKTWLSILPALLTIAAAIISKKILPSLLFGLLVGGYLAHPSAIGGLEAALSGILKILSDKDNLQVLLFLYLFSGLIALIRKAGGIDAFAKWAGKYVTTERGVIYALWALIPITFIDCAFRIIGTGSIMRSLADKNNLAKERMAFVMNNTASPVIELIPIATTFVGFNIANITQGLKSAGVLEKHSAYGVLLHAIPFEFFSIVVLLITFLSTYYQWKRLTHSRAKPITHAKASGEMNMAMPMDDPKPRINPRILNLVIPMGLIIFFSFFFFWYFGEDDSNGSGSIISVIASTDPNKAMLVALTLSLMVTGAIYFVQKYPLGQMVADIISGGNELMGILAILVVAWALGGISQDLDLSGFIHQRIGNSMPVWSIPVSLFLVTSAVTYFIGEGWAAASLMMPLAIPIAVVGGAGIPICVAAVITGGTFGDVTSPVAGMTNMASTASGSDHMKYLKYAAPYNFTALAFAAILFLVVGYF